MRKQGRGNQLYFQWLLNDFIVTVGIRIQICVLVPQHGPFSLYINLEDPINCKIGFLFPPLQPSDSFQGPLVFMVTALGFWVKQPLGFS